MIGHEPTFEERMHVEGQEQQQMQEIFSRLLAGIDDDQPFTVEDASELLSLHYFLFIENRHR